MDQAIIIDIIKLHLNTEGCISLDNFGTFLVKDRSALIDDQKFIAFPPGKLLVFNKDLNLSEHSLSLKLSKYLNLNENEASRLETDFVSAIKSSIYKDGAVNMAGLGSFVLTNSQLRFDQDVDQNFDSNSFGLPKVYFSNYYHDNLKLRPTMNSSSNNEMDDSSGPRKGKIGKRIAIYVFVPLFLVVGTLGFLWENRQSDSFASFNPFSSKDLITVKDKKNNEVASDFNYDDPMGRNTDAALIEKEESKLESVSSAEVVADVGKVKEETSSQVDDQEHLAQKTVVIKAGELVSGGSGQYYIIYASYQTLKKAEAVASTLELSGYENVKIIEPHGDIVRYRISIMDFTDKKEAQAEIKKLRPEHGNDLWIYKY